MPCAIGKVTIHAGSGGNVKMMDLYNKWQDAAAQLRRVADEIKEVDPENHTGLLIQAEQIEACAQALLKAFLKADP